MKKVYYIIIGITVYGIFMMITDNNNNSNPTVLMIMLDQNVDSGRLLAFLTVAPVYD